MILCWSVVSKKNQPNHSKQYKFWNSLTHCIHRSDRNRLFALSSFVSFSRVLFTFLFRFSFIWLMHSSYFFVFLCDSMFIFIHFVLIWVVSERFIKYYKSKFLQFFDSVYWTWWFLRSKSIHFLIDFMNFNFNKINSFLFF